MAYSDYGGYAYRNGARVKERSDAVLSPDGIKSTPGQWPGWTLPEGRCGSSYHVLLGDGPIFVSLYKQSSLGIHRLGEEIDPLTVATGDTGMRTWDAGEGKKYLDTETFVESGEPATFEVDGFRLTVRFVHCDNHYILARLEQPDGTVWHGWSGYGVGAGLEDCGYGYDSDSVERLMLDFWPDAVKEKP